MCGRFSAAINPAVLGKIVDFFSCADSLEWTRGGALLLFGTSERVMTEYIEKVQVERF
ncbi:hypothetical protein ACJX0J_037437, partial [Zea mays]